MLEMMIYLIYLFKLVILQFATLKKNQRLYPILVDHNPILKKTYEILYTLW